MSQTPRLPSWTPNCNIRAWDTPVYLVSFILLESSYGLFQGNTLSKLFINLFDYIYFHCISYFILSISILNIYQIFISLLSYFRDSNFTLFPHPSWYTKVPFTAHYYHPHWLATHAIFSLPSSQISNNAPYLFAWRLLMDCSSLKKKPLQSFQMSGTTYMRTRHNIPEDFNLKFITNQKSWYFHNFSIDASTTI